MPHLMLRLMKISLKFRNRATQHLDEKPFDPEVVSSTVVNLIKRVEARIS